MARLHMRPRLFGRIVGLLFLSCFGLSLGTWAPGCGTAALRETYNLRSQAMCFSSFDDLAATLAKLEEYSAKAREEFGEASEERWGAEVAISQVLSMDLGRTEEGLARYKAAMAKADPSWSMMGGGATNMVARMNLLLAQLEAGAGHVQEGRRALATFEANRPSPGDSGSLYMNLSTSLARGLGSPIDLDMAAMMWDYPRYATYIQLGDGAVVLREMEEREGRMPVSALTVLYKLEDDNGNQERAHEVLTRTSELCVAATEEGRARGTPRNAQETSYWQSIESFVARDALRAPASPDHVSLALWLSEERKALVSAELAVPSGAAVPDADRADLLGQRAQRAEGFLRAYDGLPPRPGTFCNKSSTDTLYHHDRLEAEEKLFKAQRRPPVFSQSWMMSGPGGQVPRGSPAAFLAALRGQLAPDSAFVGFLRFRTPGRGWLMPAQDPAAEVRYLAFVARGQRLEVIDLGAAAPIEAVIDRATQEPAVRPALLVEPAAEYVAQWKELYDRLWRPLERALAGARMVTVSPDGPLGRLPLAALHDGQRWLHDRLDVVYVRSARDIIRPWTGGRGATAALILADPSIPPAPNAYLDFSAFKRLAPARDEGRALQRLIPDSLLFEDQAADEKLLLTARSPRIIHVAAHGFVVPLSEPAPRMPSSFIKALAPPEGRTLSFSRNQDHLWMRSGLLLSKPAPAGGAWDGLATAYEIMSADLSGTEIVTLSACQSGAGAVYGRSGLASLQAAFLNAGAASVVGSLWPVDVRSTVKWMETFYEALMAGKSRVAAQRAAMAKTKANYPHPYHWAPFVLMGATGPLQGQTEASAHRP